MCKEAEVVTPLDGASGQARLSQLAAERARMASLTGTSSTSTQVSRPPVVMCTRLVLVRRWS